MIDRPKIDAHGPGPEASRLSVLVIDDSATNRAVIEGALESCDVEIFMAEDASQGTAMARQHCPDVIVLDVVLPDGDGIELCQNWREDSLLADTPVLLISGQRICEEDRAAGLRSGAMGYLRKPFSSVELVAQVHLLHRLGQATRELKARNEALEASNADLEQFAYAVSHDLKSPLITVASYCQILAEHCVGRLDAEAMHFIDTIMAGTERMKTLIDDLLTFSRVGRTEATSAPVNLGDVVANVIDNLHSAIEESKATLDVEELPTVLGNETLLAQLLQNLLGNALKFHRDASPRVRVSADRQETACRITVADNGIGIAPDDLDQIFGVFKRLRADEYEGTGIGLAICKRIVEHHGGCLRVESTPGVGSRFHIELPSAAVGP